MAERGHNRRPRTKRAVMPSNMYWRVLEESEPGVFARAERSEGLADELAVVRVLLLRQLAEHPENLDLTFKGIHLLVRMVTAQFKLSDADASQFNEGVHQAIQQLAESIIGEEVAHA